MTKELFVKRMKLIQNYDSQENTVSLLIDKLTDGFCSVFIGGHLRDIIIEMMNEYFKIEKYDDLLWNWLYNDDERVIYFGEYDENKISIETLEELYDYIVNRKEYV